MVTLGDINDMKKIEEGKTSRKSIKDKHVLISNHCISHKKHLNDASLYTIIFRGWPVMLPDFAKKYGQILNRSPAKNEVLRIDLPLKMKKTS